MLPGVELARRRRLHQRAAAAGSSADAASCGPVRPDMPSAMGEAAMLARTRLRERLRGGSVSPAPTYSFGRPLDRHAGTTDGDCHRGNTTKKKNPHGCNNHGGAGVDAPSSSPGRGMRRDSVASPAAEEVCAVCLEALRSQSQRRFLVNLPCSHNYHFDCVRPWLASDSRCPCCRKPVVSL